MDKRAARRESFALVRELGTKQRAEFSRRIVRNLSDSEAFQKAKTIFSFLALPSEPDISALHRSTPDREWSYSRVTQDGIRLAFHHVADLDSGLREGEFGFREPDPDRCRESPDSPDLILVPGVAFCPEKLARLGRGKGHYDRFLSTALQERPEMKVVGVCFSVQYRELDPEPHDLPMDALVSETGWVHP